MNYLAVDKDKIFFSNFTDEGKIYQMNLDGSNMEKLSDDSAEFLVFDSEKKGLYYTSEEEGLDNSIKHILLETSEAETLTTDSTEVYNYKKLYGVFKEDSIDVRDTLGFNPSQSVFNIRSFKNNLAYIELVYNEDNSYYKMKVSDYNGEDMNFPYDIRAFDFEILGNIIYYADAISGDLHSFNMDTREEKLLFDDCYSIIKIAGDYIFVIDLNYENILKLKIHEDRLEKIDSYKIYAE